jgi:hypothetical protein
MPVRQSAAGHSAHCWRDFATAPRPHGCFGRSSTKWQLLRHTRSLGLGQPSTVVKPPADVVRHIPKADPRVATVAPCSIVKAQWHRYAVNESLATSGAVCAKDVVDLSLQTGT